MIFDIKTLLLVNLIVNLLSSFTMGVIWYQYQSRFSGLKIILFSTILSSSGIFLILLRGIIPDYVAIVVANTLLITGLLVLFIGLETFTGKKGPQIQNYFFLFIYFVAVSYFYLITPSMGMREIFLAFFTVIFDIQICWLIFRKVSPNLRPVVRIIGLVMICHLVFSLILLGIELIIPFDSSYFFNAGVIGEIIVIGYLLLGIWTIIALVMMVTRRLLSEVQAQEEKFKKAFQSSPYAIMLTRISDGKIFEVNEGFSYITGYNAEEVIGKKTLDILFWEKIEERANIVDALSKGKVYGIEVHLKRKSGELMTGIFSADIIDINNETCILVSISDITERKKVENALRQSHKQINLLTSITRHDILNRIMVTLVYCDEIFDSVFDEQIKKQIQIIKKNTEEIHSLIAFTGQYQDLGTTQPEWQNIHRILQYRDIKTILDTVELLNQMGDYEIYADKMLRKVIYNLVENSIRHGINLTQIRFSAHEEQGDLKITYEDDGGGIVADEKEKSFKKGFGKNTGLGLFLIREILSITSITIKENGIPGEGVRFEITVPAGGWRVAT